MKMDEVLYSIAEKVKNFAVIYLVDITEVPDFNKMLVLYDVGKLHSVLAQVTKTTCQISSILTIIDVLF